MKQLNGTSLILDYDRHDWVPKNCQEPILELGGSLA